MKTEQRVSARELHKFLNLAGNPVSWAKKAIKKYRLIEDQDFEVQRKYIEAKRPSWKNSTQTDYFLTFEAAKKVADLTGYPF